MTPVVIDDGGGAIAVSGVSAAADWAHGPPRRRPANYSSAPGQRTQPRLTEPGGSVARVRRTDTDMKGGDHLVV